MDKPRDRSGYKPERTEKCRQVLLSIFRKSAGWREKLVVVGGFVPSLLYDGDHAGTTDIDLVLNTFEMPDDEQYKTLEQTLKRLGLERGLNAEGQTQNFRWVLRESGHEQASLDLLCPADEDSPSRVLPLREFGERKLSAFGVPGARIALHDFQEIVLIGELLEGGKSRVTVRVAGPVAFIVMKALAFEGRGESKDAYDLIYVLKKHGPVELGWRFAEKMSQFPDEPLYRQALSSLKERFTDDDDIEGFEKDGPVAYARFEHPTDPEEQDVAQQDAVSLVELFVRTAEAS